MVIPLLFVNHMYTKITELVKMMVPAATVSSLRFVMGKSPVVVFLQKVTLYVRQYVHGKTLFKNVTRIM